MTTTLLALVRALVPLPDDPSADLARHQGTWAVVRSVRDGREGPEEAVASIVRDVDGDRVVWKRDGVPFAATRFAIVPGAEPRAMDLIPEGGRHRGGRVGAIYRFDEGGTLVICTADPGSPRPDSFDAGPGSGATLMTFRRVDPGDARPPTRRSPCGRGGPGSE